MFRLTLIFLIQCTCIYAFSSRSFNAAKSVELRASRREILLAPILVAPSIANAISSDSFSLEKGLLESRVLENLMSTPTYGMEGNDIFYPS